MRLLFVKDNLAWPRSAGHDVHSYYMMRALAAQGHTVGLLTQTPPAPAAIAGLELASQRTFAEVAPGGPSPCLSRGQERFRSYWGVETSAIQAVGRASAEFRADAVVVVGLRVLPYLAAVEGAQRIWYAADEWAWHHLSQLRAWSRPTWGHAFQAVVKGLYERAYAPLLDRVWVVSDADKRAMRWVAGVRAVDVVANGVDTNHFQPAPVTEQLPDSCVFWGRLDFGPNVQALEWFCQRVWPALRRRVPEARFDIFGFQPTRAVLALAGRDGIEVTPDLPDLRGEIARRQVVVLPFVSGGGIKNKLLEAAALGQAIVCTPRACGGLRSVEPLLRVSRADAWVDALTLLWEQPVQRARLGASARAWVQREHTWEAAANHALAGLRETWTGQSQPVAQDAPTSLATEEVVV